MILPKLFPRVLTAFISAPFLLATSGMAASADDLPPSATQIVAPAAAVPAIPKPAATPAVPPPKGLSVYTIAHSFHSFVPKILNEIAKSAGITDHRNAGLLGVGGSTVLECWNFPNIRGKTGLTHPNPAKDILATGKIDALTLSPIWMPDEGIEDFARYALQYNPDIRIFVQEFWMPNDMYHPVYPLESHLHINHDATDINQLIQAQNKYDQDLTDYVKGINARIGKQVLFVVPVGQAVIALRQVVISKKFDGIKYQDDLFNDGWGHPAQAIQVLDAYCYYACIYKRSPVGIPQNLTETGLSARMVKLLQQIAWDTVSHYPMSGVTPDAAPSATPAATPAH